MKLRTRTATMLLVAAAAIALTALSCAQTVQESPGSLDDVQFGKNPNGTGNDAGFFFQDQPPSGNVRTESGSGPALGSPTEEPRRVNYFGKAMRRIENRPADDPAQVGESRDNGGIRADTGEPFDMFFKQYGTHPFIDVEDNRQSTFAVDVDTGSYTVCRDYLNRGNLPPNEAPRVEEFVNYFKYKYEAPVQGAFRIAMDVAPSRYGQDLKNCHILRVGLQAKTVDPAERKPAVLTFVVDVSGSMNKENRLGLVKQALQMLVKQLGRDSCVSDPGRDGLCRI